MSDAGNPSYGTGNAEWLDFKQHIMRTLHENNAHVDEHVLAQCLRLTNKEYQSLQNEYYRRQTVDGEVPKSWDYAFVFQVADKDAVRKPTSKELKKVDDATKSRREYTDGIPMQTYYGQIIYKTIEDLNGAKLDTRLYRTRDNKFVILLVGMTETNLKIWADNRDTDLPLDPVEAVREGRRRKFPLALRTIIEKDEGGEDDIVHTLPSDNWNHMYVKYDQGAPQQIYEQHNRIPNDPTSDKTVFNEKQRLQLLYEAIVADKGEGGAEIEIEDHLLSSKHPLVACFPLHDQAVLDKFTKDWLEDHSPRNWFWTPLEDIRSYFGEPVAFYFGFMMFYLKWLCFPSAVGAVFFIIQLATKEIAFFGIFFMCLFMIGWCVAFVDFWYRQEARYRLKWGMTKFESKAVARPQFKGEWQHDSITGLWVEDYSFIRRGLKSGANGTFIVTFMGGCVAAVLSVLLVRDRFPVVQGFDIRKVGLGVANGVMIAVFDIIYKMVSRYGNEWENHRTQQDFENSLIIKGFVFKFFNSFASLFYLSFVRSIFLDDGYYIQNYDICGKECTAEALLALDTCVDEDHTTESSLDDKDWYCCVTEDLCDGASETKVFNTINDLVLSDLRLQLVSLFVTAILIQNSIEVFLPWVIEQIKIRMEQNAAAEQGIEVAPKSEAEEQMIKQPYENTIEDMSEIVGVQFGYVTLFVMAFPLTPFLAMLNNVIELKVDGTNLVKQSQRPHVNGSSGLGAWDNVLGFFSLVAVGTNVALITFRTGTVAKLSGGKTELKWIFFSIASIVLALVVAIEKAAIPDVPWEVELGIERQRHIEYVLVQGASAELDGEEAPKLDDDEEEFAFDPDIPSIDAVDQLPPVPLGNLTQLEEEKAQATYSA